MEGDESQQDILYMAISVAVLFVHSLLFRLFHQWYERYENAAFARAGGPDALERAGIVLPGFSRDAKSSHRKELRPSSEAPPTPATLFNPRKNKDFWGLKSVPEVALSGVKTIDKVVKPGGAFVASVTKSAPLRHSSHARPS